MARPQRPRRHPRVREAAPSRYAPPAPAAGDGLLLDSDVIIEVLRGRRATVGQLAAVEAQGIAVYTCAVSRAEIHAGLRSGEETVTDAFFDARGDLPIDAATGRRAGVYLSRYAKSHGLEIADALIAAVARTAGLRLWTLNRRDYPMEDLRLYEG